MTTDTLIYVACTIVGAVLAFQVTRCWWREKRDETILIWMISAWVLTAADPLAGLLPVCSWCKKVRDDDGYWKEIEEYFSRHTLVHVTHGICRACAADFARRNH